MHGLDHATLTPEFLASSIILSNLLFLSLSKTRFEFYDYYTQVYNGVNVSFFFEFEEINPFNPASFIFHLY